MRALIRGRGHDLTGAYRSKQDRPFTRHHGERGSGRQERGRKKIDLVSFRKEGKVAWREALARGSTMRAIRAQIRMGRLPRSFLSGADVGPEGGGLKLI